MDVEEGEHTFTSKFAWETMEREKELGDLEEQPKTYQCSVIVLGQHWSLFLKIQNKWAELGAVLTGGHWW